MGFFDDLKKRWRKPNQAPLWEEVIKRPDKELQDQRDWAKYIPEVLDTLSQSYHYPKLGLNPPWHMQFFESAYANGFALSYPSSLGPLGFQHLFDLLRDQVLGMGYRMANSDRKLADKETHITTTEKHYLKPIQNTPEPPLNQRYGNVLIELIKEDDTPQYLKVMVTTYNDRRYLSADSFDDFIKVLFTPPT